MCYLMGWFRGLEKTLHCCINEVWVPIGSLSAMNLRAWRSSASSCCWSSAPEWRTSLRTLSWSTSWWTASSRVSCTSSQTPVSYWAWGLNKFFPLPRRSGSVGRVSFKGPSLVQLYWHGFETRRGIGVWKKILVVPSGSCTQIFGYKFTV